MANTVPTTVIKVLRKVKNERGTVSSMTKMSLEKRFTILPRGVVSKKDIGECIIFSNIPRCKFLDAVIEPDAKVNDANKIQVAWPKPKPPYVPRYLSRCSVEATSAVLHCANQTRE